MIIGSGLIATAFRNRSPEIDDICIFAAGVSNSQCEDAGEYARENARLTAALREHRCADAFVYFSTCSINDFSSRHRAYVKHKKKMESLVEAHPRYMILRLPQLAGRTPNPHTLLNFLHSRISRSEKFDLWIHSKRNVIDIVDVVSITHHLIKEDSRRNMVQDIACPTSYTLLEIVRTMEKALNKTAIYRELDNRSACRIDISDILDAIEMCGITFSDDYLRATLQKYYQPEAAFDMHLSPTRSHTGK